MNGTLREKEGWKREAEISMRIMKSKKQIKCPFHAFITGICGLRNRKRGKEREREREKGKREKTESGDFFSL